MREPSDSPKSDGPDSPNLSPAKTLSSRSHGLAGLRSDLAEFGESFKSSFAGISKIASNLFQLREDEEEDDLGSYVPGINGEVVHSVEEIAAVPEYWTDFSLALEDDFEMSNTQKKHAVAIEQLAPSLRNLRVELESSISQEKFWRIYFTRLLSKLDKHDFELLATPKIKEVRDAIMMELQNIEREKLGKSKKSEDGTETTEGENSSSGVKVVGSEVANAGKGKEAEDDVNNLNTHSIVAGQRILVHEDYFSVGLPSLGPMQEAGVSSSPAGSEEWVELDVSQKVIKSVSGDEESEWVDVAKEAASSDGSDEWISKDFDTKIL